MEIRGVKIDSLRICYRNYCRNYSFLSIFSKLLVTRNTATRITLTGAMEVIKAGNADVTCLIDLDEIIPFLPED